MLVVACLTLLVAILVLLALAQSSAALYWVLRIPTCSIMKVLSRFSEPL